MEQLTNKSYAAIRLKGHGQLRPLAFVHSEFTLLNTNMGKNYF